MSRESSKAKAVKSPLKRPKVTRCGQCYTCQNKHLKKVQLLGSLPDKCSAAIGKESVQIGQHLLASSSVLSESKAVTLTTQKSLELRNCSGFECNACEDGKVSIAWQWLFKQVSAATLHVSISQILPSTPQACQRNASLKKKAEEMERLQSASAQLSVLPSPAAELSQSGQDKVRISTHHELPKRLLRPAVNKRRLCHHLHLGDPD